MYATPQDTCELGVTFSAEDMIVLDEYSATAGLTFDEFLADSLLTGTESAIVFLRNQIRNVPTVLEFQTADGSVYPLEVDWHEGQDQEDVMTGAAGGDPELSPDDPFMFDDATFIYIGPIRRDLEPLLVGLGVSLSQFVLASICIHSTVLETTTAGGTSFINDNGGFRPFPTDHSTAP